MNKLLIISLCTSGVMREHFIFYARHFTKRYNVYCITNDNVSKEELGVNSVLNVRYKRNEKLGYFSLKKIMKIKKYIKDIQPDLIYVFTPHPANILLASFLKKYPLAFQVHDPIPHSGTSKFEKMVLSIQLKQYYKYSKVLFVAGNELKEQIKSTSPKYYSKVKSVPFGVLDNLLYPNMNEVVKYDAIFFGRIEFYKGIDVLVDAASKMTDLKFLIVGKGDINNACNNSNLVLSENIRFINEYVPDEELIKYICQSKIVVLPYRDATGSMTICISHYYSKPVVATSVGVFPEYVGNGGILVDPNSVEQLISGIRNCLNEDTYFKLSSNARDNYCKNFDIEVSVNRTSNILDSIIKR